MRIIHTNGFHDDERRQIRAIIYSNVIVAFRVLLQIMETEGYAFADEKTRVYADLIEGTESELDADIAFGDENVREAMSHMWADAGVQKAIAKGHEYALNDNLALCVPPPSLSGQNTVTDRLQLSPEHGPNVRSRLDPERPRHVARSTENDRDHRDNLQPRPSQLSHDGCWWATIRAQEVDSLFRRRAMSTFSSSPIRLRSVSCRRSECGKHRLICPPLRQAY